MTQKEGAAASERTGEIYGGSWRGAKGENAKNVGQGPMREFSII
jgi:hypothetical protein